MTPPKIYVDVTRLRDLARETHELLRTLGDHDPKAVKAAKIALMRALTKMGQTKRIDNNHTCALLEIVDAVLSNVGEGSR